MTEHSTQQFQLSATSQMPTYRLIPAVSIWLVLVASSVAYLTNYSNTAAPIFSTPSGTKPFTDLNLQKDADHLLVFLHPKCSCSIATVRELQRICLEANKNVSVTAVFYRPPRANTGWELTELWHLCANTPNMRCVVDPDGHQAARFGVCASGHVLLLNQDGDRQFDGGVLKARGHRGTSVASVALADLIRGKTVQRTTFPVFGCRILSDSRLSVFSQEARRG